MQELLFVLSKINLGSLRSHRHTFSSSCVSITRDLLDVTHNRKNITPFGSSSLPHVKSRSSIIPGFRYLLESIFVMLPMPDTCVACLLMLVSVQYSQILLPVLSVGYNLTKNAGWITYRLYLTALLRPPNF